MTSTMPEQTAAPTSVPAPLIPITKPFLGEEEAQAAAHAVRSGWIAQGPMVAELERRIAARLGVEHAIVTSNCTTSLHVALVCRGIGPGDEVICPSFTFIATANSVLYVGATPVFVDIDPRTYNIDPAKIEAAITPRTRAIMPVDQIGLAADLDAVHEIANRHGLHVIEDAAPALGATYKGRPVGAISSLTCFSFHPRKSITTGEGGAIATNDDAVADRARVLRSHGASISDLARHNAGTVTIEAYEELGFNYRMTDIQAAIGIEQMKKLDDILARRRRLAERYNAILPDIPGVSIPYVPDDTEHTYQSYCIRLDPARVAPRNDVMERMLALGVATRRGIMAIHEEPYYASRFGRVALPVTEAATRETLLLPLFASMTEEEQDRVIEALRRSL
ncbi:MAG TPA: DegT/DnrJ/EryC1/StrS family aminotransferase [Ktedonobacterales bacterium]|nr:DegT/DnrJ/EryC1/StrS family aminotransferase [Ktedonobacterales bacterium]